MKNQKFIIAILLGSALMHTGSVVGMHWWQVEMSNDLDRQHEQEKRYQNERWKKKERQKKFFAENADKLIIHEENTSLLYGLLKVEGCSNVGIALESRLLEADNELADECRNTLLSLPAKAFSPPHSNQIEQQVTKVEGSIIKDGYGRTAVHLLELLRLLKATNT